MPTRCLSNCLKGKNSSKYLVFKNLIAPKRERVAESSSRASTTYDATRFVSEASSERFNEYLVNRNLIKERGLVPFESNGVSIRDVIRERRWGVLIAHPEVAVVSIMKEFYAHAAEARDKVAMVRGK